MNKNNLRAQFKHGITLLSSEYLREQSHVLAQKIETFLAQQTGMWAIYSPLRDEPNLMSLLESCPHIQWAFPVVLSPTQMEFRQVRNRNELVASSWGLLEPSPKGERVKEEELVGVLIPGLAFDHLGYRLGRGGGYYDRFLQYFKGLRLGVTFDQSLSFEALPSEPHDQKMDIIVSPAHWLDLRKSEVRYGN